MDASFSFGTSITTTIVFGLEFLASIFVGSKNGFGFPSLYLAVSCSFGVIAYAITSAAISGSINESSNFPGYLYAIILFSYLHFLMLVFLPVLAIFLLIRKHNQRNSQSGGSNGQTHTAVKAMVYFGFLIAAVALILLIASLGLVGNMNATGRFYDSITYVQVMVASFMVLWYFIVFWTIVAPFHRSLELQHLGSFIAYGVLITLPMIISTITTFEPTASPYRAAGQYANFALYNIPLFFAVAVALVSAHRWIDLEEQNHPQSA